MIVVSDTTAITSLLKISQIEILETLFGEIIIPQAVQAELTRYHGVLPAWLLVQEAADFELLNELLKQLDLGEAEAITLAKRLEADFLIIDEKRGRLLAEQLDLRCIGLAGVLLLAKKRRLIDSLEVVLDRLEKDANFYLSIPVKRQLIVAAGERLDA